MKPEKMTEEAWRQAGLKDVVLGPPQEIDLSEEPVARGLQAQAEVRNEALVRERISFGVVSERPFLPIKLESPASETFYLYKQLGNPTRLRVAHALGLPLWAAALGDVAPRTWYERRQDEPRILYLNVEKAPLIAVFGPGRVGLALHLRYPTLEVRPFHPEEVAEREPLFDLSPPLEEWAEKATYDGWLAAELRRRARLSAWDRAVGAGIAGTLQQRPPGARERIQALLRGEPVTFGVSTAVWTWAAQIPGPQKDMLAELAQGYVDLLLARIDGLERSMCPAEPWWVEELRITCIERDDLTRVSALLYSPEQRPATEALKAALNLVDQVGRELIDSLPRHIEFPDERLWRAAILLPDKWWTELAVPPEPPGAAGEDPPTRGKDSAA